VATNDLELERLGALFARCVKNGLDPERLDGRQLSEREPRIIGKGAIFVQSSSITEIVSGSMAYLDRDEFCGVVAIATASRLAPIGVEGAPCRNSSTSADFESLPRLAILPAPVSST
jgi:L-2-hydroxyglutarate oxidase LhgO